MKALEKLYFCAYPSESEQVSCKTALEGVALKFSDIEYGKIAIQRMEEKVLIFDGESFKSAGVQIVEHLKKENDSRYRFILLTDVAKVTALAVNRSPFLSKINSPSGLSSLAFLMVSFGLSKYCRDAGIT